MIKMLGLSEETDLFHSRILSDLETNKNLKSNNNDLCMHYFNFSDPSVNSIIKFPGEIGEIKVYYENDLNLREIHTLIKEKFIKILKKLYTCDSEILNYQVLINSGSLAPIDVKDLIVKIKELQKFKYKYTNFDYWSHYKAAVLPILIKYTPVMSKECTGDLTTSSSFTEEQLKIRHQCIKDYIDEVNKLGIVKIKAHHVNMIEAICPSCMKSIQEDNFNEIGGNAKCSCGYNETTIKHLSEYIDTNRSIVQSIDTDLNAKQIKTWLERVKCSSGESYDKDNLFNLFDKLCINYNLPKRKDVFRGRIPQPPMSVIISLIKLSKKTELYVNKHQIRNDYYGHPGLQVNEAQESVVIKLYIDFQNRYEEIKKRKTKVHIEILGCIFLIMAGVNVNPSDFKIPESRDTISYSHNSIYEVLISLGYERNQIPNVLDIFS